MSLINQVLKDLEHRREGPAASGPGSIVTTPRYTVARGSNSFVIYMFGFVLFILSLAMGFLVWDRLSAGSAPLIMSTGRAPAPAPTVTFRPEDAPPAAPDSQPPADNAIVGLVSPARETAPAKKTSAPVARPERTKAPASAADRESAAGETPAEETAGSVQKQPRPLTPKQLGDRAFRQGYAALQGRDRGAAEQHFREALRQLPGHVKSREMLAGLYIKSGRYVEAGQLLRQGIAIQPGYSMFRKLYARVLLEQDALDRAVAVLETRLPPMQADMDYYALLAALYQRQGRHENAVALYQNMLKENPVVGIWWIGLGISLEKLARQEDARKAYEKARASGTLAAQMIRYTDNRLAALEEIGYPDDEE